MKQIEELVNWFHGKEKVIVALSGGVDSALVAYAAQKALGKHAIAITADYKTLSQEELEKSVTEADVEEYKLNNPLLQSGLLLAGANKGEGNEGVITALEATTLDLWGTKLVVLSACDTGVGEVKNGDGVYGLRRGLVLAGSESQLMSLWPVSDSGTRDLMIRYYKALENHEGRSSGLRRVRLEFLKDPKLKHPYYWASFIQSGEWANLDGKR